MNLMELKKSIKEHKLNSFYIFTGDETAIRDIYVQKLCAIGNYNIVKNIEQVKDIYARIKNKGLLDTKPNIFIIKDDKSFTTSSDSVFEQFKTDNILKNNILILIYTNIDKRGKFYKTFEDDIVVFDYLSDDILTKYIRKDLNINSDRCLTLIDICERNYNRILLEIDKIKNLISATGLTDEQAFDLGLEQNLFTLPPEGQVYDLVNAILDRNIQDTYYLYKQHILRGDNDLALLSLLYNNMRSLLQVQLCNGSKNITNLTGLTGWQIKNLTPYVNAYSTDELIKNLNTIKYCENSAKNGAIEPNMIIDYLLINIL